MKAKPMPGTGDPRKQSDDPEQSRRFKEKALEIEAGEDLASFSDALDKAVPIKLGDRQTKAALKKTDKSRDKSADVDKRAVVDRK